MPAFRQLLLIVAAALAVVGGVIAVGATGDETSPPAAPVESADGFSAAARAAVPAVEAGASLLDVREQEEWDESHATPAQLFTLGRIERGELPKLAKDAKVLVYCRSGRRAQIAVDLLRKAGFTDVTNIGGLTDWEAAGGAVTAS